MGPRWGFPPEVLSHSRLSPFLFQPFIQAQEKAGNSAPDNNSTMPQSSLSPPGSSPAILLLALGLAAAFLPQLP